MHQQTIFDSIRQRTKPETHRFVQKNLAIVAEVSRLMKEKGWTQKELAKKLQKTDSEVSKWLSGLHNLTLKSITKLEAVLEADLLEVPQNHASQMKTVHNVLNEKQPK
jgi:transcriptional regulator with XRE-family HTH domain